MKRILLTAMQSNAGKTVMTCALLAVLKKRGLDVRSFKCGPDYIDPMFHSRVLEIPSRNLDLYLQGTKGVRSSLLRNHGSFAVLEGAMGYYDGLNGTAACSAWETAVCTKTPAVLVVRPRGAGVSLAAQIKGMKTFRPQSGLCGILLAECTEQLAAYLSPILEKEAGLPVFGYLPPMPEAQWGSRHLGLLTADEVQDLSGRISRIADQFERTVNVDRLLSAAEAGGEGSCSCSGGRRDPEETGSEKHAVRIAVARDSAFCFYYEDSFDALRRAGAELVWFSPLQDQDIPEHCGGLYLGGGYPELFAASLSENTAMRTAIRKAADMHMPLLAECGGFLYLQQELEDSKGQSFPMCGFLPGKGVRTNRLQRFGYQKLRAGKDSLLFREGEKIPAHEFHYWDSTECGADLLSVKENGRTWPCGFVSGTLYAAFPHLHLGGEFPLAERFVRAAEQYAGKRETQ